MSENYNVKTNLRPDLAIISDWIKPGSRVLDLGCGDGTLMRHLQTTRNISGYGLELDPEKVRACITGGVNVIHSDLNKGLSDFDDNSFDYVVMTQALQVVSRPDQLIEEMLRVGREGIVTFPNFGNWRTRAALLAGHMPVTKTLPSAWYSTTNIHLCTVDDFEQLCAELNIEIIKPLVLNSRHQSGLRTKFLPNLMGELALYHFRKKA